MPAVPRLCRGRAGNLEVPGVLWVFWGRSHAEDAVDCARDAVDVPWIP